MSDLVTGEAVVLELRTAQLASRSVALALDLVLQLGTLVVGLVLLNGVAGGLDQALQATIGLLLLVGTLVGYPVAMETLTRGRTLGKMAFGLRVVRDDGGPIGFRQALVRGLLGVVEIILSFGIVALVVSLGQRQGKRVGDLLAGTVVIRERVATGSQVPPPAMPPPLAGWAAQLELSRMPGDLALAARQYLGRWHTLDARSRADLGGRLATAVSAVVTPPPPAGVPAEAYLSAVLAERRRRELARTGGPSGSSTLDIDAYVMAHRAEWDRLEELTRRRRPTGAEADELVVLYQRTATHLSVVRSASPDPVLVARLSTIVARARSGVTGAPALRWRQAATFVTVTFPAALHRGWRWWVPAALVSLAVAAVVATWVAATPEVQASIAGPEEIRQLVDRDFENYYSANPAGSFAAQVWTNNAWVAALCLALGAPTLGLGVLYVLFQNVVNVGIAAGLLASAGKLDLFFGLILPHGLLELTAVFVAAGSGLRLGWCVVDPGPRTRTAALAEEGRAAGAIAVGLVGVLLISGIIEAFVTPSGLPTWARIAIGVAAELAFIVYVVVLGGRAVRAGETGDVDVLERPAAAPTAA